MTFNAARALGLENEIGTLEREQACRLRDLGGGRSRRARDADRHDPAASGLFDGVTDTIA
jgi:hypothetical protein